MNKADYFFSRAILFLISFILINTSYANSLQDGCSNSSKHISSINSEIETFLSAQPSLPEGKTAIRQKLKTLIDQWEELQISNNCFNVGPKSNTCNDKTTDGMALVVSGAMLFYLRATLDDINSKSTSVIKSNMQKRSNDLNTVLNNIC